MKRMKKAATFAVALSLIVGVFGGCTTGGSGVPETTTVDPNKELDEEIDYQSMAENNDVPEEAEVGVGSLYVTGQKAGTIDALCYYDLASTSKVQTKMLAENYGGVIETQVCGSMEYMDVLGKRIAAGDSPDIVRYDWQAFPWGASKNMYTPLDEWLDIESPLWSGEREVIDAFEYAGKHYYFPSNVSTTATTFALAYNRLLLEDAGLDDPMQLYFDGNWTWDTFEEMLKIWANQGDDYVPFTAGSWCGMMFINSTGEKIISVEGDKIINNLQNENVQRTMDWLSELKKQGLTGEGYVHPGEAFVDGKLLFLGMGLTWTLESAQETFFKQGVESDIVAVPIPRDPQADKYYMSGDTLGYLVPAGSSNVQGGIAWILCNRIYETDPVLVAEARALKMSTDPAYYAKCPECKYNFVENDNDDLAVCPECGAARKEKFKVIYSEDQMRVIDEMNGGEKITLVFDNVVGFDQDFSNLFTVGEDSILDGPAYFGASFTQLRDANYGAVEAYLEPYRDALVAASAG